MVDSEHAGPAVSCSTAKSTQERWEESTGTNEASEFISMHSDEPAGVSDHAQEGKKSGRIVRGLTSKQVSVLGKRTSESAAVFFFLPHNRLKNQFPFFQSVECFLFLSL